MYLTVKNQLRQLSAHEFQTLREMCRLSKNLYNEALYNVRQYYFSENKYLHYESNYHLCKSSPNYKTLGTEAAQQTMKVVDRNFRSFFALVKKAQAGAYNISMIRMPRYLLKEGYFPKRKDSPMARGKPAPHANIILKSRVLTFR